MKKNYGSNNFVKISILFVLTVFIFSVQSMFSQATHSAAGFDFNDKGIIFASSDSTSKVTMRFRIQNTMTLSSESDKDLTAKYIDFGIRRARLRFGGSLYDPRLTFNFQFGFSRSDLDQGAGSSQNPILDAVVYWNFSDNLCLGLGQTKLPGNRQYVMSSGDLQFADRSIVNSSFSLDRDFGLHAAYKTEIAKVGVNLQAAVSTGDGRNAPKMSQPYLAYTGRFEILPFGKFTGGGDYFESDLARETKPKLSLGVTYSKNKKANRTRGQVGESLYSPRDMDVLLTDLLFKYNGFSAYAEYAERNAKDPITTSSAGDFAAVLIGKGYMGQIAYLFNNNIEIGARVAVVSPSESLKNVELFWNQHNTAVITYYIHKHRAKIQLEQTLNNLEYMKTGTEHSNWITKLNLELGI